MEDIQIDLFKDVMETEEIYHKVITALMMTLMTLWNYGKELETWL